MNNDGSILNSLRVVVLIKAKNYAIHLPDFMIAAHYIFAK
jgi:hypothetical protein